MQPLARSTERCRVSVLPALTERIGALHATFKAVLAKTERDWLDEIVSHPSPRDQLLTWEIVSWRWGR